MDKRLIHIVLEHVASLNPDSIAVQQQGRSMSYYGLNAQANGLANELLALDLRKGDVVAVLMPSSIEMVTALLATFKSGGIYLPLDIQIPEKRILHILAQSNAKYIITDEYTAEVVKTLLAKQSTPCQFLLMMKQDGSLEIGKREDSTDSFALQGKQRANTDKPRVQQSGEDANYIFYTSGSTGEPKAILGYHKSLGHFIDWEVNEFAIDSTCRIAQLIQTTFDASLRDIFVPLATGGLLLIPSPEIKLNPAKLIEWLDQNKVTLLHYVPSLFRLLIKEWKLLTYPRQTMLSLKKVLLAGEALYAKDIHLAREVMNQDVTIVNLYGPTETTMVKTFYKILDVPDEPGKMLPVGKAMSNTTVAVINDGIACAIGEIGEVYIKTPFMTKGYPFDAQAQQKNFVQNPLLKGTSDTVYKTGDLGRWLPTGDLEIIGRVDKQIKVNGVRIELEEIERVLAAMEGIEEVVVTSFENDDFQLTLVAYYSGRQWSESLLQNALRAEMVSAAIPEIFMYVEKFPLNLNGKIDKNALPKPQAILLPDSRYEAVVTDTEERLETIWKDILSVDRIGRKVSFFDIGGTSLKGIKLIARIYKETGILLKVADLFTHPTIQKLAPLVEASQTGSRDDINATSKKDYYEITHSQKRLWLVDQSKKGQTAYNIASVYRLIGNLHMPSFATAIERIVERHESLRTTFHTVEGQPLQRIAPMEAFPAILEILDWRGAQDIEEQTLAITRQKREHAFDLEKGPLFVATLIREKDDRFVFLFTIHHIISDAWSLNVLINDALVSYKSIVRNEPSTLPNLVIQFKDYAEWENRQLAGENVEVLRKFWLQQFAGELFPLKLPTDFTRPGIEPESKGRIWQFELTEAETTALKKLEQTTHVTLFMKLLAVVNVLLSKYSGQKDIIVGIPVANRTDHKLERQVGFYVNTLAVRNTLDVEKSFRHFLQSVQSTLLRIYDHAVYPYDRLLEDLQITLQPGENGLFNVMVQLQDTRSAYQTQELDGLTVQKLDDMERSSKFDLTFNFEEENNVIIVSIEYSIDLFRPETLARYQHDFQTLIRSIIAHPDMTLVELHEGLLTEDQKQRQEQYVQEALTSISEDY